MISQNTYLHKDIDGSKGFIQSSKTREELYSTVLRHPLIQSLPHEQNGNSCQMKQKFQNQQSRQISQLMNLGIRNYFKMQKVQQHCMKLKQHNLTYSLCQTRQIKWIRQIRNKVKIKYLQDSCFRNSQNSDYHYFFK